MRKCIWLISLTRDAVQQSPYEMLFCSDVLKNELERVFFSWMDLSW